MKVKPFRCSLEEDPCAKINFHNMKTSNAPPQLSMQARHASQKQLGKQLLRAVHAGETARARELIASGADVETRHPVVSSVIGP